MAPQKLKILKYTCIHPRHTLFIHNQFIHMSVLEIFLLCLYNIGEHVDR